MKHIVKSTTIKGVKIKHYIIVHDKKYIIIFKFALVPIRDRNDFPSFIILKIFKDYFLMVQIIAFKKETFNLITDILDFPNIYPKITKL